MLKENTKANPQCKIDIVTTHHVKDPATIDVQFKDGNKFHIDGSEMMGDDIVNQVQKYSNKLTQQEDLKAQ
ncbi:hypothetical protein H4R20_002635 [Coemansia guatemalensis]|uniref:Uncharacterized protein n=1 Tax=Coemansia guatemalensis TaxID=2761395 RepID=A0A9W8HUT5_9FUNG|nr:hypothetical protein H4R20_002635 [Coemansia guatemalensis]